VQLPHVNVKEKFEEIKGASLTDTEEKELNTRIEYAHKWLDSYSPEEFVFKIQGTMPPQVSDLTITQKELLTTLADFLQNHPNASGEQIQTFLYDVKNERGLDPITVFQAIYVALLGRESGPKAGWLLEALEKDFLIKRFSEAGKR
jgi:lysyl-tRNA synthetase class 1